MIISQCLQFHIHIIVHKNLWSHLDQNRSSGVIASAVCAGELRGAAHHCIVVENLSTHQAQINKKFGRLRRNLAIFESAVI